MWITQCRRKVSRCQSVRGQEVSSSSVLMAAQWPAMEDADHNRWPDEGWLDRACGEGASRKRAIIELGYDARLGQMKRGRPEVMLLHLCHFSWRPQGGVTALMRLNEGLTPQAEGPGFTWTQTLRDRAGWPLGSPHQKAGWHGGLWYSAKSISNTDSILFCLTQSKVLDWNILCE